MPPHLCLKAVRSGRERSKAELSKGLLQVRGQVQADNAYPEAIREVQVSSLAITRQRFVLAIIRIPVMPFQHRENVKKTRGAVFWIQNVKRGDRTRKSMINDRALVPNASACLLVYSRSDDPNRDLSSKYPQLSWVRRINDNLLWTVYSAIISDALSRRSGGIEGCPVLPYI